MPVCFLIHSNNLSSISVSVTFRPAPDLRSHLFLHLQILLTETLYFLATYTIVNYWLSQTIFLFVISSKMLYLPLSYYFFTVCFFRQIFFFFSGFSSQFSSSSFFFIFWPFSDISSSQSSSLQKISSFFTISSSENSLRDSSEDQFFMRSLIESLWIMLIGEQAGEFSQSELKIWKLFSRTCCGHWGSLIKSLQRICQKLECSKQIEAIIKRKILINSKIWHSSFMHFTSQYPIDDGHNQCMAAIIKQNFTLAYVRVLIDDILAHGNYKQDVKESHNDLKSILLNFAARVSSETQKTSIIYAKELNENEQHSWSGEKSFLQALQIDQRTLRSNLLEKDKQIEFMNQQLEYNKQMVKKQAETICELKNKILLLTQAYEEAKDIFYEQLHKKGESELMSVNDLLNGDPKKTEVYELTYQLSTTQRSLYSLKDKLQVAEEKLKEKQQQQQILQGQNMVQKNDIIRMEKKIRLLEQANKNKKQKIEDLLKLLGSSNEHRK